MKNIVVFGKNQKIIDSIIGKLNEKRSYKVLEANVDCEHLDSAECLNFFLTKKLYPFFAENKHGAIVSDLYTVLNHSGISMSDAEMKYLKLSFSVLQTVCICLSDLSKDELDFAKAIFSEVIEYDMKSEFMIDLTKTLAQIEKKFETMTFVKNLNSINGYGMVLCDLSNKKYDNIVPIKSTASKTITFDEFVSTIIQKTEKDSKFFDKNIIFTREFHPSSIFAKMLMAGDVA